jgi:hypothetical protein
MKPINEMNLLELADYIQYPAHEYVELADRLRQIYDQTRWISITERMPTKEDGNWVRWFIPDDKFGGYDEVDSPLFNPKNATHWQRINYPN